MTGDLQSHWEQLAIEDECAAANQLLLAAIRSLHRLNFIGRDEYILTATLASGAERLVKLTLGFLRHDVQGQPWPTQEFRRYGHDITGLDRACREFFEHHLAENAPNPKSLRQLGARLNEDLHLSGILDLISDYAKGGRFYNLDYLGGDLRNRVSVREQWQRLIIQVATTRPDRGHLWALPSKVVREGAPMGFSYSQPLRSSVEVWRDYYLTAWQYGICGKRAQRLAENIASFGADLD